MKRKLSSVLLVLVLSVSLVAAACTREVSPTKPATSEPSVTKPTPKPIVLKFGNWTPSAETGYGKVLSMWLDEVEKRTSGRVKFERYWAEALAPAKDTLDALNARVMDVGTPNPSYTPGKLPLGTVGSLAGTWSNIWPAYMALGELYRTVPAMSSELGKNKVRYMASVGGSPYYLLTKRPVKSLGDVKNLRISATGAQVLMVKELGGVPVSITLPELNTALERGTVDGAVQGPTALVGVGLHEVAKYYFTISFSGPVYTMAMNIDAWNSLPSDIQKIIDDLAPDYAKIYHQTYQIDGDGTSLQTMKKAGVQITDPSDADKTRVQEVARTVVWNQWIADREKEGLPGREVLDTFLKSIAKYNAQNPFK